MNVSFLQGDTLENVDKELDCIIETGFYTFQLAGDESGNGKSQMFLEYIPSTTQLLSGNVQGGSEYQDKDKVQKEHWSMEQIGDFVRKLGFIDKEKEGGDKIKNFLEINQVICI